LLKPYNRCKIKLIRIGKWLLWMMVQRIKQFQ
jgi:hypothetical protein